MSTWIGVDKNVPNNESLLLETNFYLLQENSDRLVLEQSIPGSITWYTATKSSTSWSDMYKIGIDDILGVDGSLDILTTEGGDYFGLDQSNGTGVTWTGTNKT